MSQFQFSDQNGVKRWCDFGANLVQHFMLRYSRYSRYQTVFLKLEEIISTLSNTKNAPIFGAFFYYLSMNRGANYDCLAASYDTLCAVMMLAKLAVMSDCVALRECGQSYHNVPKALITFAEQNKCVAPPCKRRSSQRVFTFLPFLWYNTTNR